MLTKESTAKYVLDNTVTFGTTAIMLPEMRTGNVTANNTVASGGPDPIGAANAVSADRVVRFAVKVLPNDDKDTGDRNSWLFLFATGDGNIVGTNDPSNAGGLVDIASVAITDDD